MSKKPRMGFTVCEVSTGNPIVRSGEENKFIGIWNKDGFGGSCSTIEDHLLYMKDATHVVILEEYGNGKTAIAYYPKNSVYYVKE